MVVHAASQDRPRRLIALDRTLAALAEPTRRGVVDLLRAGPRRASDIATALSTTRPAMSRHLRVLRKAGLVREDDLESDARARVYRLERAPFTELQGWLEEVEAFWSDQLESFKAYAESQQKPSSSASRKKRA
jgi:DNA-binding transcriptional ArsR family regulator